MKALPSTLALALSSFVGCAHAPAATVVEAGKPAPGAAPVPVASTRSVCTADSGCGPQQKCVAGACVAANADCGTLRVHFGLNDVDLRGDDRANLERSAQCLRANQGLRVTIEGNADERGTDEYNIALGDRRATVVARYLETLGVSKGQLATVSFGEEHPICKEHDEGCWSANRRAAVKVDGSAVR